MRPNLAVKHSTFEDDDDDVLETEVLTVRPDRTSASHDAPQLSATRFAEQVRTHGGGSVEKYLKWQQNVDLELDKKRGAEQQQRQDDFSTFAARQQQVQQRAQARLDKADPNFVKMNLRNRSHKRGKTQASRGRSKLRKYYADRAAKQQQEAGDGDGNGDAADASDASSDDDDESSDRDKQASDAESIPDGEQPGAPAAKKRRLAHKQEELVQTDADEVSAADSATDR